MKRYKGILVLVLCMSIFALSGCGKGDDDSENTENEAVDVSDINVEVAYPTVRTISQSGNYIRRGTTNANKRKANYHADICAGSGTCFWGLLFCIRGIRF